jgi:hypothetical protein
MTIEESYEFVLRWSNRRETPEQCAVRLAQTIDGLSAVDSVFGQWKRTASTFEEAHEPFCKVPADREELARIFAANARYDGDPPGKLWLELGYAACAWNGMDEPFTLGINVYPGTFDSHTAHPNSLRLSVSHRRLPTEEPWQGAGLRDIMRLLLEAWEADEARVDCWRYHPESPQNDIGKVLLPQPGWLTYLSPKNLLKVTPPNGVRVDRLPAGGLICTICEEPFTIDNPRHVELAEALNQAMRPIQAFPSFI